MKLTLLKIFSTIIVLLLCVFLSYAINFNILDPFIVGDPCKYDTDHIKISALFDLFYTTSSDTGFHPEPSGLNFGVTILTGLLIGVYTSGKFIWRKG